MNDGLFSPDWHRIAKLQPKLHKHIKIHRHVYRGLIWYLFEDTISERSHRFNSAAYKFIGLLDGRISVEDIYTLISENPGDFIPGQQDIVTLLGQLYAADLIQANAATDIEELFDRKINQKQALTKQRFLSPVSLKIPLWDPEDFLNKYFVKIRWLFSPWVAVAWTLLLVYTLIQSIWNWPQISQHFNVDALSSYNLLLLFILYPIIKILHELGHAFSAKLEGGEVHEMGVNFLLFIPVPYVNVSTATHFRSKYKRMLVSAAGILVESFIAMLGLLLFLAAEPGLVKNIGFNVFMIGGISSLFFNGNPLLKYDGYYILADAIDIHNLYQRSSQYWGYLLKKYILGLHNERSNAYVLGEKFWFLIYGLLSNIYRLFILWFVISFVTEKFFIAGIVVGVWLIGLQVLLPLLKGLHFITFNPHVGKKRPQVLLVSACILSALTALIGFAPAPLITETQGVLWQTDDASLIAAQDGFAGTPLVDNNQWVETGTPILNLYDPLLKLQLRRSRAKIRGLEVQYRAKRFSDYVQASIHKEEIRVARSELDYALKKVNNTQMTAGTSGRVLLLESDDLVGRFVRKGEPLGYILSEQPSTIRMVVTQDDIGQLRQSIVDIRVRFANDLKHERYANVIRQTPEAVNQLPSGALSTHGGGKIIVKPPLNDDFIAIEKIFLVDLIFAANGLDIPLGTRVYIRINHGSEALAKQLYRRIKQVFLRQFNV